MVWLYSTIGQLLQQRTLVFHLSTPCLHLIYKVLHMSFGSYITIFWILVFNLLDFGLTFILFLVIGAKVPVSCRGCSHSYHKEQITIHALIEALPGCFWFVHHFFVKSKFGKKARFDLLFFCWKLQVYVFLLLLGEVLFGEP